MALVGPPESVLVQCSWYRLHDGAIGSWPEDGIEERAVAGHLTWVEERRSASPV